jgi:serine/threonine-protein kinase
VTDTPEQPDFGFADDAHRYRLDSRIATGGMGEVWRATDTVLGREVAVKLLKAEYADDPAFRSRFETEARHAASLHHPNVAAVYDFGEAERTDGSGTHRPYLVMEVVDGQPLSALLRRGEPLDPDATRDLLAQAADAIGAAHAVGIVHRDVKPANLLVTPDRQVKITDFGIARAAEGLAMTETGQVMGTPQYLSPEQARGETATPASDVYSLGVVAFECLAGRRPFVADTAIATALAHLREPVPELPAGVPADLAAVVRRSLAKNPADRFPDGAAFAAALRDPATAATAIVAAPPAVDGRTQVLPPVAAAGAVGAVGAVGAAAAAGPATAASPVAPVRSEPDRRRALPWLVILLGLLLAAVVVFALVANGGGDDPTTPDPTHRAKPSKTPSQSQEPSQEPSSSSPSAPQTSASSSAPSSPTSSAPTSAPTSQTPTESPSDTPSDPTTSPSVPASAPASTAPSSSPSRAPTSSPTASRAPTDHRAERPQR